MFPRIGGSVALLGEPGALLDGNAGVGSGTLLTGGVGTGIDGIGISVFMAGTGTGSTGGRTFLGSPVGTGSGTNLVFGVGSAGLDIGNRPGSVGTGSGTSFSAPDRSGLNGGMTGSSGFGSGGTGLPESTGVFGAVELA